MEDSDITRFFELLDSDRVVEAEQFAAALRSADPTDSLPICFVAETHKRRDDRKLADDLLVEAYRVEVENGQRIHALKMILSEMLDIRVSLDEYDSAYPVISTFLSLGLPMTQGFCDAVLTCVSKALGHSAVDAAGRNLLYAVATDEESDMVDKEKLVAFVFSKMADLQVEELPGGSYRNLDPSMAGITRLRRNCGIPWSYVTIIHGASNPAGEDLHLLARVMIPWRVSHGNLNGEPVEEMPTAEISELQSKGMLGLDECVKTPPPAPWESTSDGE